MGAERCSAVASVDPPCNQRQGDQHLNLVVVHAPEHLQCDPAAGKPEQGPADRLLHEQFGNVLHTGAFPLYGDTEQHQEHDDGNTVVEQRLAGYLGFHSLADTGGFQNTQHGNGIGRGYQRAEQQAVDQWGVKRERAEQQPRRQADDRCTGQYTHSGQQANDPLALEQVEEVDMHGAGEQQKRQHAIEQGFVEIDLGQQCFGHIAPLPETEMCQCHQQQREYQRDHHDADGCRQAQCAGVDPGEQR